MPSALPPEARIRFVRRFVLMSSGLSLLLSVLMGLLGNGSGGLSFLGAAVAGGLLLLLPPRWLLWVRLGLPGILWAVVVELAVVNGGGLGAPVLVALPLVPTLALFVGARQLGMFWLLVSLATPVGLGLAEPWIGAPRLAPEMLERLHLLAPMVSCAAMGAFAWQYERAARTREVSLHAARREAEAANAAKSTFLATMSHEIRTPLGGILGVSQLLRDRTHPPEQAELVALVERSARGLLALVDQILDLSRIESGTLSLETAPFRPAEIAEDVLALHRVGAERAGLALRLEVEAGEALWVLGDPLRFRQIVQNLVGNALKFTAQGSITVRLWRQAGALRLEVEDTGIGIAPEAAARLVQPFQQADAGTARRFGGTGLGLSIVARLCEAMGGAVTLRSVPGAGSCFRVELPLPLAPPPGADAVEASTTPEGCASLSGLRVLLADDNSINRAVFSRMLERLGCEVLLAEDGQAAVDCAAQSQPALVLMDINMPGMDGFEATRLLRAQSAVPVLALTASVTEATRTEARSAGMSAFLTKPLTIEALQEALLAWAPQR